MNAYTVFTCVALAALLVHGTYGMLEDQAGTYDWYKQHIGQIEHAVFHATKPRVCVATAQSVVGCLNLRDGSLAWRKLLAQSDGQFTSVVHLSKLQTLVIAADGQLRTFDLDGNLKWQRQLRVDSGSLLLAELLEPVAGSTGGALLISHSSELLLLDGSDGSVLLKHKAAAGLDKPNRVAVTSGQSAYLLAYDTGSTQVAAVDVKNAQSAALVLESPLPLSSVLAATERSFAAVSLDGTAICTARVDGVTSGQHMSCQQLSDLAPGMPASSPYRLKSTSSGYILSGAEPGAKGAVLLALESDGQLKLVKQFQKAGAVSAEVRTEQGTAVGLLETTVEGNMTLVIVDPSSGAVIQEEKFPGVPKTERLVGKAPALVSTGVVLGTFRRKDKSTGYRALVSYSNGVTVMLQQGVIVWLREESLATIKETLFMDLPAPSRNGTALQSADDARADFHTRLRYQVLGAKIQFKLNSPDEATEFYQLRSVLSDKNTPVRDVKGFRKLLMVLTKTGKLAALHNGDGRILWSRAFDQQSMPTRLLPWRTYHDTTHPPEILLLRETHPGAYAAVLNAHTGEELSRTELSYGVRKVVSLNEPLHEGSAYQSLYLLLEEQSALAGADAPPAFHLLPDTTNSRAHFKSKQEPLFFVEQGPGAGVLQGLRLTLAPTAGGGNSGSSISVVRAWQLALPDSILATASRDPTEPVQSSVKVLSDRSIKYKYLNPNLLFVATGVPNGVPADDSGSLLAAEVTVHLIDTVTGRILHRQSHTGARGPVTAVLSENFVLYYFRDLESGRFVACSMELYDATSGREFSVLDYLFNPNSTKPISSYQATPMEVVTQSFFSRIVPKAATVTRTEQGITARQILLITNTDQVYALDRRWVDPRRPKKQKLTQDEIEEGLVPYQDNLPLSPLSFSTLDKQVLGLRNVNVEATRLESTCLMFAHGVDLFFTRLAPAKGFDSLEDDFNYALLLAALVGLSGGAFVMHYMTKQTTLNQKWK